MAVRRKDWGALFFLLLPAVMLLLGLLFQPPPPPSKRLAPIVSGEAGMVCLPNGGLAVDLNKADAELLDALPGIGPALAGRILELRGELGRFDGVEQLLLARGIGPSTLKGLRGYVAVAP